MMELSAARAELDKVSSALEEDILIWNERAALERREARTLMQLGVSMASGDITIDVYLAQVLA